MSGDRKRTLELAIAMLVISWTGACSTAYYSTWEMLGKEKRDLLRSNVKAVQKEQREVADDFEDALDRLRGLYDVDADDLEKVYDKLKGDFDDAEGRAEDVHERIGKINSIAEADRFLSTLPK